MSVAPAGVALTGNTPGPESKYRLAPNRNNQWPSRLQILSYGFAVRGGDVADIAFADDPVTTEHGERLGSILLGRGRTAHAGVRSDATWAST